MANETVLPSSLGFADDGELWRELGGTEGLFRALEARGVAYRDWFVLAKWAEEAPQVHELPTMNTLHPIQDYVNIEALERYMENPEAGEGKDFFEKYPVLFRWNGKTFIFQGTHRLASLYASNARKFTGYVLDLSK